MGVRKNTLWRVPLYGIVAGIVSYYLVVYVLGRFMIVTLADGTVTIDDTRSLILYGAIFVAAVLIGGVFFFRKMTKLEIFLSATILVAIQMAITLLERIIFGGTGISGTAGVVFMYLYRISTWSSIVSQLVIRGSENLMDLIWVGAFVENLAPYLFVLFGRKPVGKVAEE